MITVTRFLSFWFVLRVLFWLHSLVPIFHSIFLFFRRLFFFPVLFIIRSGFLPTDIWDLFLPWTCWRDIGRINLSGCLESLVWNVLAWDRNSDKHIYRKPYLRRLVPFFVDCWVGARRAYGVGTDTAMVLAELPERHEADLALWLFFIALFVLDLKIWLKKKILGTVSVIAFRLAALLVPSTEAAMRKELVINVCAL